MLPLLFAKTHAAALAASVGAGNTGNLPLVIVSTLARTSAEILGGVDPRTAEVRGAGAQAHGALMLEGIVLLAERMDGSACLHHHCCIVSSFQRLAKGRIRCRGVSI